MIGTHGSTLERHLLTPIRLALAAAGVLLVLFVGLAGSARAQTDTDGYPITTSPTVLPSSTVQRATTTTIGGSGGGLPVTGADIIGLTVLGVGLVGTGFVVLKARDRRAQTA